MAVKYGSFQYGQGFYGGGYLSTLVTDRASGAYYTHEDLNRVGEAVDFIASQLHKYGYAVTVLQKTDWAIGNIPTAAQMTQYLADVLALKTAFYGTTTLPACMNNLTAEQANNIELLFLEIEIYINRMIAGIRKCGTFKSGQGVKLP